LAVLKAHWEAGETYVDIFLPFLAECAVSDGRPTIPVADLRAMATEKFGFSLPQDTVIAIMKRASRKDLGRIEHRSFQPDLVQLAAYDRTAERAQAGREQVVLVDRFIAFSQGYGVEVTRDEAEEMLIKFIEDNASSVLAATRGLSSLSTMVSAEQEYLVAAFILKIVEPDPALAGYLERLVIGSMLATAIYTTHMAAPDARMDGLTVFFDTGVLLDALGHAGPESAAAALESLRVIASTGARLACFEHTVKEVESILHAVGDQLHRPRAAGVFARGVEQHALASGLGRNDLYERAVTARSDVQALGILPTDTPDRVPRLQINETDASELLRDTIGYHNPTALRYDLDSLMAIHLIRHGARRFKVEQCGAVFVTGNGLLVNAGRKLFGAAEGAVPVAMRLTDLVTLAWLKQPAAAPNLPKLLLSANCYAAIQPSDALMRAYVEKAEQLRASGKIDEEQVYELCYGLEERRILMTVTKGVSEWVTTDTVTQVMEKRQEETQQRAEAAAAAKIAPVLEQERTRREQAERSQRQLAGRVAELEHVIERAKGNESSTLERRAHRVALWTVWPLLLLLFVAIILVLALSTPGLDTELRGDWGFRSIAGILPGWIAVGLVVVTLALAAYGPGWGGLMRWVADRAVRRLEASRLRRYRQKAVFKNGSSNESVGSWDWLRGEYFPGGVRHRTCTTTHAGGARGASRPTFSTEAPPRAAQSGVVIRQGLH
jgi:hypothetical protein